jgi:hypothetical protein
VEDVVNYSKANPPQFFLTPEQVEMALANPGLGNEQKREARDLAAVQSSMSPDNIVLWIMGQPKNEAEGRAQNRLAYIEDRRHLSAQSTPLSALPIGTPEEQRAAEVAGATILGHYGLDRSVENAIKKDLKADRILLAEAATRVAKQTNEQLKANFLTGLFNDLTKQYRLYLRNLSANAPAAQNLQAQWRQRLADAERRLNEQIESPTALRHALSKIATFIPENLLQPGTTNQQVIDWANQQAILHGVVSDRVRNWMLVDDGTGKPAMASYQSLVDDMAGLRDVLQNQLTLGKEIKAFEEWFNPSGVTKSEVSAKRFAEAYFKFRTGRDRVLRIARTIDKEVRDLDTRIHGNIIAADKLEEMMISDGYTETVRLAAARANVAVRALYGDLGEKTGLIERDRTVGLHRMQGPQSGTEYVVDLYPSSSQEAKNRGALSAFAAEARAWPGLHVDNDPARPLNSQANPLLADEYLELADYIDKYLNHPSLDPAQGFTQVPYIPIPGTTVRIPIDIFDGWTAATSAIGYSFQTIRDVLERVGGRVVRQAVLDGYALDTVMRKVDAINADPKHGFSAMTQAVLKAIASHGWSPDMFAMWDEKIAERVLAAGQNDLGPSYSIGDTIIGASASLTEEDVAAIKIMKQWEDAVLAVAPNSVQDRLADLGISRKAVGYGRFTMARIAAPWSRHFVLQWRKATTDAEKIDLLKDDLLFRNVVLGYLGEFNPEFSKMDPASSQKSPLFEFYRRLALTEKEGIQTFSNLNAVSWTSSPTRWSMMGCHPIRPPPARQPRTQCSQRLSGSFTTSRPT